ncbi:MAG: flagellar export protein FliJ [Geobacteraceae bacterium]|nr:flagellar export protein FliJ [Geobacteraceae bacterium]
MQRNVFTLERVLHFRKEAEKLRKLEFATAKQEYELAEDHLRREEEAIEELNLEFMTRQIEGISALELQLYADFFQKKNQDICQQRDEVVKLDRHMVEKKDDLIAAATDKKIMEELKKKKVKAHEKALADKEQGFLDEIALRNRGLE